MTTAIAVKTVRVALRGLPPGLLQASKRIMDENEKSSGKATRRAPEAEAELHCHWTGSGKSKSLAIPWVNLYNSFCKAAGNYRHKGKATMSAIFAATVSCERDMIPLNTTDYEVFTTYCRIPPKTGAMVKVSRPLIRDWSAAFNLFVDDEMYQIGQVKLIIAEAGKMVGIGPWRPSLKGAYGRFIVEEFEVL